MPNSILFRKSLENMKSQLSEMHWADNKIGQKEQSVDPCNKCPHTEIINSK